MKTRLKTLLLYAVLFLLLGIIPQASALWVGENWDIHMDIPGVVANDFHVEGRIESSLPPTLIDHIDGGFPNFVYSIVPDPADPTGLWYIFRADWSGMSFQYCQILHIGLLFDVTCHNVMIDLVGWWTKDGQRIPPNIVPPPVNGGAVMLPGFDVQDQPPQQMPQHMRFQNDSDLFGGGGGGAGGIQTEMVALELVSLTHEQLTEYLGSRPFEELRLGGRQQNLRWIAVENSRGVISTANPQPFRVDSFFDVFFDISYEIHPVEPLVIPPGGFLIARELLRYTNNAGEPALRWVWEIHGAHESQPVPEHDLGDAPDSTNSFSFPPPIIPMTAYPKGGPMGVQANYPSVYIIGSPPHGPIHMQPFALAFLGQAVSLENEADIGPDQDPTNNIIPPQDAPDLDLFDDGVKVPLRLPHCKSTTFDYWVTIQPWMPPQPTLFVNVWFDWNRDGDWDDTMQCPGTTAPIPAPEWAVRNQQLPVLPVGLNQVTSLPFMPWHPATGDMQPIWMRITLSEQKWSPTSGVLGDGGSGPAAGYMYGETEDYYFVPEEPQPPDMDFGDAPEAWSAGFKYPTTLANNGARHIIVPGVCLGAQIDSEKNGQPTLMADGDDVNNLADEDGVISVSALVPGTSASVVVVASVAGSLSAWVDYNADGDWDDPCDMVFGGWPLGQGANTLQFTVPATAVPGPTYARLRFTTADTALRYDGLANDGEVEDYIVKIEETPPKPPVEHLKWSQPPIEKNPRLPTPIYCGWDEPSYSIQYPGAPTVRKIVADDFRCLGTMPVTSIHWWGSYKGYNGIEPPQPAPIGWQIGFWTNVPPPAAGGISQPGKLLWLLDISAYRVKQERVGVDIFPGDPPVQETCFQYYVQLNPEEYFRQERYLKDTALNTYWISISAIYPAFMPPPNLLWGWKTRPWHWMDDAITFRMEGELQVGYVLSPNLVNPIEGYICGQVESYDAAFELDTDPNWIKWEQAYTGIRDWPHYEDEKSMGELHTIVEPVTKYLQKPDLAETGIDVDATFIQTQWRPQILADDFNCVTTGLITDIHIWGSWYHDYLPGSPNNVQFLLTIYSDDPIGPGGSDPTNKYSKPDLVLWRKPFYPGQFNVSIEAENLKEGYFVPCAPYYEPLGDKVCYKYDFNIDPCEAFPQKGTTAKPITYWLAVQAHPIVGPQEARFGWKTSFQHWNDDAVWAAGSELPYLWNELRYPSNHPLAGNSIDLAFAITTQTQREEFVINRLVADDWRCLKKAPVTAIVWWGSYIGYRYEACQCQATTPRPIKPDYFLLSIWTDVPANPDDPDSFSHPGQKKWEYKAYDYDEVLVGYDKHPIDIPGVGYEPVFRYSVKLPETAWFHQKEAREIFWLSVVAVYKNPLPVIYPWGWTNHKHVLDPPDDAVAGYMDATGVWIWEELYDQRGDSEDMSFVLFTDQPGCWLFPTQYTTYADWVTLGKPNCWCGILGNPQWPYQCDGDADNLGQVVGYRVYTNDLTILSNNWKKKIADPTLNPCADFDHKGQVVGYRVYTNDLTIMSNNWKKKAGDLPANCPRPE